jgi:hypothetical protein
MIQILLLAAFPFQISGHGSLIEPPSCATMHDYGFPQNPTGMLTTAAETGINGELWLESKWQARYYNYYLLLSRCGICGDAYDAQPRQIEAPGGLFANGVITRGYTLGQEITVTAHITDNHVVSI